MHHDSRGHRILAKAVTSLARSFRMEGHPSPRSGVSPATRAEVSPEPSREERPVARGSRVGVTGGPSRRTRVLASLVAALALPVTVLAATGASRRQPRPGSILNTLCDTPSIMV